MDLAPDAIAAHVQRCLRRLGTDYLDAFFLEYVRRGDEEVAVQALRWMRGAGGLGGTGGGAGAGAGAGGGPVRYLGCSTHDRGIALELLRSERKRGGGGGGGSERSACELDLLMARYNMAHVGAEAEVFPLAQSRGVPIVAFTSTRWNSLQKGHPQWSEEPPTPAECMRFALSAPAVQVVLHSTADVDELAGWVQGVLGARGDPPSAASRQGGGGPRCG